MQKKNVEALATPDDCLLAEEIAKADPGVQAMLQERNITSLDLVACDPWSGAYPFLPPTPSAHTLCSKDQSACAEKDIIWTCHPFWPESCEDKTSTQTLSPNGSQIGCTRRFY
jgi:hypothetical protein